jgi:DNA polymerase-3 subunit beta
LFQLTIKREDLLAPLLMVFGAVDKKQSLPLLANFLLKSQAGRLFITATDLEVEITAQVECEADKEGSSTVPAKKFIDIIRSLDDNARPSICFEKSGLAIKQGTSSFRLATLPADNYPASIDDVNELECRVSRLTLLKLLESTHFALAQQDVRVFLNALLLDFQPQLLTAIGTDGHRMAISREVCDNTVTSKLLLPRKAVQEIVRLLHAIADEDLQLSAGKSHFKLVSKQFAFTSKLIEARFPPYTKAIPVDQDKSLVVDSAALKRVLTRIVILANEKSRAVTLSLLDNQFTLIANNNDQEEAEETLAAETQGGPLRIGFNANYLLDVLNYFGEGSLRLSMSTTDSSILVQSLDNENYQYIIMPMKI